METPENEIAQEISEEQGYFNRLPDDLIISHIFGKIPDAKCLFSCFLLSKRLGFLVLQSKTISCTILGWFPSHNQEIINSFTAQFMSMPQKLLSSLKRPFRFLRGLFPTPPPSLYDKTSTIPLLRFIKAFKSLKHLYVEVSFSSNMRARSSLIDGSFPTGTIHKWKADFKSRSSETFVMFLAKSLAPFADGDGDHDDHDHGEELMTRRDQCEHLCIFKDSVQDALLRLTLFAELAPFLSGQLQSIVITDSRKQGKFVLGAEWLAELRSRRTVRTRNMGKMVVWSAGVVRLPLSGYVMKGVTVFAVKAGAMDSDEDFESVAKDAFEGDEIFGEAIREMLKKPAIFQESILLN